MTAATFARMPLTAGNAGLTATDWEVLHAISRHIDPDGVAWPSLSRIAAIAGIRRNHVSRSIARLERLGLLRRERRVRPGGGWQKTVYWIVFEALNGTSLGAAEDGTAGGARVAPDVVPDGTCGGALTKPLNYTSELKSFQGEGLRKGRKGEGRASGAEPAPRWQPRVVAEGGTSAGDDDCPFFEEVIP